MVDRVYRRSATQNAPQAPDDPSMGYPTDGNPSQGVPATIPGAYWYHMITESLRRVIVEAGLEPNHLELGRLASAIRTAATTEKAGIVEKATTQEAEEGAENKFPDAAGVQAAIRANAYNLQPIGVPFGVLEHLPGVSPPSNSGPAKFIRLTAGEDGLGQYNEGLLTNETVTGSGPTVLITAEIATGLLAGGVVNLLNSENRYLMPGETSGALANDQMQQITGSASVDGGSWGIFGSYDSNTSTSGAISKSGRTSTAPNDIGDASGVRTMNFDSADSPGSRTGDHTNVKHIQATYYMRIA